MLDTSYLSDFELVLEVANPGTNDFIDVYYDHLFLPPKKTK